MITSEVVTVAVAPTVLSVGGDSDADIRRSIAIRNSGAASIWVGGDDVTNANGWEVPASGEIAFDLIAGDILYGATAAGTVDVVVLQTGV